MTQQAWPRHPLAIHPAGRWSRTSLTHFVVDRFLLLPIGAAIALVWANTAAESYFTFAHRLAFPVNEIGMALFFGLLTQEVVEALMPGGALHTWRRWTTALAAAAGGVAGAAAVYTAYISWRYQSLLMPGWPVACAIDAAAAYYVLKTIAPRTGLLPFVLIIALLTNAFGAVVVGLGEADVTMRLGGGVLLLAALAIAAVLRARNVRNFVPYVAIAGSVSWTAFYLAGVHPAFALVPIVPFLPHEPRRLDVFAEPADDDATHHYEHEWNVLVQIVLLLFGLVNAGVLLRQYDTGTSAVLLAALIGRPAGILLATAIGVAAGLHLPKGVRWPGVVVLSLATSSGFTLALFFATGIFAMGPTLSQLKLGALLTVAGALLTFGAARLLRVGRYRQRV